MQRRAAGMARRIAADSSPNDPAPCRISRHVKRYTRGPFPVEPKQGGRKAAKNRPAARPLADHRSESRFPLEFVWLLAACDAIGRSELGSLSDTAIYQRVLLLPLICPVLAVCGNFRSTPGCGQDSAPLRSVAQGCSHSRSWQGCMFPCSRRR
jgi:hypothetical protein